MSQPDVTIDKMVEISSLRPYDSSCCQLGQFDERDFDECGESLGRTAFHGDR